MYCHENSILVSSIIYQRVFMQSLHWVLKGKTCFIETFVYVSCLYSIWISFWHGYDTKVLNVKVLVYVINAINRLIIIEQDEIFMPRLTMMAHYADMLLIILTILQYYVILWYLFKMCGYHFICQLGRGCPKWSWRWCLNLERGAQDSIPNSEYFGQCSQ